MANLILRCLIKISFYRWVHSECASVSEPPDEKCVCIICREAQTVVSETELSSTQVDEKTDPEEPMELGMYFFKLSELLLNSLRTNGVFCDLCPCKYCVYSDLDAEVVEMEEVHKSITEEGSHQEKIVDSTDPHLDGQDSTEEQTSVARVSGSHLASMHESWFSSPREIFQLCNRNPRLESKWCLCCRRHSLCRTKCN